MTAVTEMIDTADQDRVMSWLQDRELKDHKLGAARGGRGRAVDTWSAIDRMREKAYEVFPQIERELLDRFVRDYIDPLRLMSAGPNK